MASALELGIFMCSRVIALMTGTLQWTLIALSTSHGVPPYVQKIQPLNQADRFSWNLVWK